MHSPKQNHHRHLVRSLIPRLVRRNLTRISFLDSSNLDSSRSLSIKEWKNHLVCALLLTNPDRQSASIMRLEPASNKNKSSKSTLNLFVIECFFEIEPGMEQYDTSQEAWSDSPRSYFYSGRNALNKTTLPPYTPLAKAQAAREGTWQRSQKFRTYRYPRMLIKQSTHRSQWRKLRSSGSCTLSVRHLAAPYC